MYDAGQEGARVIDWKLVGVAFIFLSPLIALGMIIASS